MAASVMAKDCSEVVAVHACRCCCCRGHSAAVSLVTYKTDGIVKKRNKSKTSWVARFRHSALLSFGDWKDVVGTPDKRASSS